MTLKGNMVLTELDLNSLCFPVCCLDLCTYHSDDLWFSVHILGLFSFMSGWFCRCAFEFHDCHSCIILVNSTPDKTCSCVVTKKTLLLWRKKRKLLSSATEFALFWCNGLSSQCGLNLPSFTLNTSLLWFYPTTSHFQEKRNLYG